MFHLQASVENLSKQKCTNTEIITLYLFIGSRSSTPTNRKSPTVDRGVQSNAAKDAPNKKSGGGHPSQSHGHQQQYPSHRQHQNNQQYPHPNNNQHEGAPHRGERNHDRGRPRQNREGGRGGGRSAEPGQQGQSTGINAFVDTVQQL